MRHWTFILCSTIFTMKPLNGIKVIDLTHMLAGPYAGMVIADLGAEVVKVEPLYTEK